MALQSVPPSARQPPKTTPPPSLGALFPQGTQEAGPPAGPRKPEGPCPPGTRRVCPPEPPRNPGISSGQPLRSAVAPPAVSTEAPGPFSQRRPPGSPERGALTSQSRLATAAAFLGPFLPAARGRGPRSSDITATQGAGEAAAGARFARPALREGQSPTSSSSSSPSSSSSSRPQAALLPNYRAMPVSAAPAPLGFFVRQQPLPPPSLRAAEDTPPPPPSSKAVPWPIPPTPRELLLALPLVFLLASP